MSVLVRALIAVLLGVLVTWVVGLFGVPHAIAVLAGVVTGLLYFFGTSRGVL